MLKQLSREKPTTKLYYLQNWVYYFFQTCSFILMTSILIFYQQFIWSQNLLTCIYSMYVSHDFYHKTTCIYHMLIRSYIYQFRKNKDHILFDMSVVTCCSLWPTWCLITKNNVDEVKVFITITWLASCRLWEKSFLIRWIQKYAKHFKVMYRNLTICVFSLGVPICTCKSRTVANMACDMYVL